MENKTKQNKTTRRRRRTRKKNNWETYLHLKQPIVALGPSMKCCKPSPIFAIIDNADIVAAHAHIADVFIVVVVVVVVVVVSLVIVCCCYYYYCCCFEKAYTLRVIDAIRCLLKP
ncbi:hypothetical protein PP707_02910 [Acetobacter pasteurianus]|nr:hypothetical protein [Acetobacter pasteurianus]